MSQLKLTKKQKIFYDFIVNFIKDNGYSPSYREIAAGLNYKSIATVSEHIENLINLNYLYKKDNSARSLEVVTNFDQEIKLFEQIKIRYQQLDQLDKTKVNKAFKILNIDQLNEIIE